MTNTPDDNINLLKQWLGIKFYFLSNAQINQIIIDIDNVRKSQFEVSKFIDPFYNSLKLTHTKDDVKKMSELICLGKLFYSLNKIDEVKIVELSERPDFIVKYKNELIGIEITGLHDDNVKAEISDVKKILSKYQSKIIEIAPDIKDSIHLKLDPSRIRKLNLIEEENLVNTITIYIISKEEQTFIEELEYLELVFTAKTNEFELVLLEDYWLKDLDIEFINKIVKKKDSNVSDYLELHQIDQCWLLIVIEGVSASSSFNLNSLKPITVSSSFNRVFILDAFAEKLIAGEI